MRRIVTVTANTAVDQVVEVSASGPPSGRLVGCYPSGKGINVARAVISLGREAVALGFVGRETAALFHGLRSDGLRFRLTEVEGHTRTNVTYIERETGAVRHEKDTGFTVTKADMHSLERELSAVVLPGDVVVMSGSLPPGADPQTYARLIEQCHTTGATVILDSSGDEMRAGIRARPFMIKPNQEELEELAGYRMGENEAEIVEFASHLVQGGIQRVVVSRESRGILVVDAPTQEVWTAELAVQRPPVFTGSVGSGDALVAGFAVGLNEELPLHETIRLAVACATANLFTVGPGVCLPEDVDVLLPLVAVKRWADASVAGQSAV